GAIVGSMTALIFDIWIAVGAQLYGKRPVKLIQNPISGCFPNNLTVAMNASLVNIYNTTMTSTPYDEAGHISMPSNSQVTSNEGFFLYNISYVWYGFMGFFLTLIIGIFVSLCSGGDRGEPVEAHLIFPIFRKLYGLKSNSTYDLAEMDDKIPPTATSQSIENKPHTTSEYHNERSPFPQSTAENASALYL
ncbi:sodium-dependent multivitamin transporter-like, partial [Mizuhopecten yessoensis]|uniref:sodium-dependent multivitamin transporter-like n=1 Tax=Mizuhopecten yessoensis TaxID=6573 RepID=UPI000B457355